MKREEWLDDERGLACILVALGHLVKSFIESGLIIDNQIVNWFVTTIYYFHVPIFFFCSGYLYQKKNKVDSLKSYTVNLKRKIIDLGIPYITFSVITYLLKLLFSGSVNTEINDSLLSILLRNPINQMWYLYALIGIFAILPTINNKKSSIIILLVTLALKIIVTFWSCSYPMLVWYVMGNAIWFVLGMETHYNHLLEKRKCNNLVPIAVYIIISIIISAFSISFKGLPAIMAFGGIVSVTIMFVGIHNNQLQMAWRKMVNPVAKYMLQIYLLHTICAACMRSILFKVNIRNLLIHTVVGLIASFVIPIIIAIITEKSVYLNIFFFPTKTCNVIKKNKNEQVKSK